MNKVSRFSALAIACAAVNPVFANDKLEEIIVISSRVEMPLRQIGTSVSVVTQQDIQQRGFSSLFDILCSEPAIAASNTGGAGKATSLRIRGEEGFRTLVLLDGINISDTSGTQVTPKVEHLMSTGISRVEILRGPQGLMYGADAGGVVNISSTAPTEGIGGQVSAEGGRYGSSELAGSIGGANELGDFILSVSDYQTDGFNSRTTDTNLKDSDGYDNTTVHGKAGWNASEDLRFELVARNVSAENDYDACFTVDTFAGADQCTNDYDMSALRALVDYSAGGFNHQLSYSNTDTEREFFSEGKSSFTADGSLDNISYLGSYSQSDSFRLVYGIDLKNESIESDGSDIDRDQNGYYAEYQGGFSNSLFITMGVRHDDNDDFGSHTSYRASGAYVFDLSGGELKLRGAYGTGFRPPSLYEIAYNSGPFAYSPASDAALKEESSEGYDIGLSWFGNSGLFVEAVYFDQKVEDQIDFDLDSFSGYVQGDGTSTSSGVELIAEIPLLESLALTANYTYNDTETAQGAARARRPEQLANIGINWRVLNSRVLLGFNARASYDAVDTAGGDLDDYTVVDINASFEVFQGLELYGRVENLFDEEYEEVPTYNTSGTAGYVGARWAF